MEFGLSRQTGRHNNDYISSLAEAIAGCRGACKQRLSQGSRHPAILVGNFCEKCTRWDVFECIRYTGWPKKFGTIILYALTLPNINRFSKLFHCRNQEKFVKNTITKDPPHPKCIAALPSEMSSVLKATIESKTSSVTTHFKKLTTGNNVFIVSVIV